MLPDTVDLLPLMVAALISGLLDASVGSGGAVLLPALIAVAPAGVSAAVPLAVHKTVSVAGNLAAALHYRRSGGPTLGGGAWIIAATLACALLGVVLGVWFAARIDVSHLTWLAAVALTILMIALVRGTHTRGRSVTPHPRLLPPTIGAIAVYDGLIGPATGSLLQVSLQKLLGRPAHHCLALARVLQALLNLVAAIILLLITRPDPLLLLLLAALHALGGTLGARFTQRIPAMLLQRLLIVCIAISVVRMVMEQVV